MNKSIEFIKLRISEPDATYNMPQEGWDEANVFNPIEQCKLLFGDASVIKGNNNCFTIDVETTSIDDIQKGVMKINVEYNTDADFEYFTNVSSTHDGTFLFIGENIRRLLEKIIFAQTLNTHKITEEFKKDIFSHNIKYTIGDIVMHSDFGTKNINGNMMTGQTDVLCLPIKFEIFKNKEE